MVFVQSNRPDRTDIFPPLADGRSVIPKLWSLPRLERRKNACPVGALLPTFKKEGWGGF